MKRLDKALLVCVEYCDDVEKDLTEAGYKVFRVGDGGTAIFRARKELFDCAVLVSTGDEMDLAETALNLKDIRITMPIVIVLRERYDPLDRVVNAIQDVRLVSKRGLAELVRSLKKSA